MAGTPRTPALLAPSCVTLGESLSSLKPDFLLCSGVTAEAASTGDRSEGPAGLAHGRRVESPPPGLTASLSAGWSSSQTPTEWPEASPGNTRVPARHPDPQMPLRPQLPWPPFKPSHSSLASPATSGPPLSGGGYLLCDPHHLSHLDLGPPPGHQAAGSYARLSPVMCT